MCHWYTSTLPLIFAMVKGTLAMLFQPWWHHGAVGSANESPVIRPVHQTQTHETVRDDVE